MVLTLKKPGGARGQRRRAWLTKQASNLPKPLSPLNSGESPSGWRTSLKSHSQNRIGNPVIVSCETSGSPWSRAYSRYSLGYISRVRLLTPIDTKHSVCAVCGNHSRVQAAHCEQAKSQNESNSTEHSCCGAIN